MIGQPLDVVPIGIVYVLIVLAMLAVMEAGYRLSRVRQRKRPDESGAEIGLVTAAALALLGFLLAFLVGFAANISSERRHLVVGEANAIRTAYLRAEFLGDPHAAASRDLLREYTGQRLALIGIMQRPSALARSEEILEDLWILAEEVGLANDGNLVSLYIGSLNDVINVHSERINLGLKLRVAPPILSAWLIVSLLTVFLVGIQSGYSEKRNYLASIVMVLILSVVLALVVDLDRSTSGLMRVPQRPLYDLQDWMRSH